MEDQDIQRLFDTVRLDEALAKLKPRPRPSIMARHGDFIVKFIFAGLIWTFLIWMASTAIEKAAFDAVNTMKEAL